MGGGERREEAKRKNYKDSYINKHPTLKKFPQKTISQGHYLARLS